MIDIVRGCKEEIFASKCNGVFTHSTHNRHTTEIWILVLRQPKRIKWLKSTHAQHVVQQWQRRKPCICPSIDISRTSIIVLHIEFCPPDGCSFNYYNSS